MEKHTCLHSEPARNGQENNLKKNPGINPGQPAEKGRGKKNPSINLGQPAGKGPKKKEKKRKKTLVSTLGNPSKKCHRPTD
jgi:hypothetical protein